MNKNKIISIIFFIITIIFCIISIIFLPETVVTQININGTNTTVMSKYLAILFPTILCIGGEIFLFINKEKDQSKNKSLFVCVIGIIIFILMLVVNL